MHSEVLGISLCRLQFKSLCIDLCFELRYYSGVLFFAFSIDRREILQQSVQILLLWAQNFRFDVFGTSLIHFFSIKLSAADL